MEVLTRECLVALTDFLFPAKDKPKSFVGRGSGEESTSIFRRNTSLMELILRPWKLSLC